MYRMATASLLLVCVLTGGCATMIRGTSEMLEITSEPDKALAKLSTGQEVITPGSVKMKRDKTVIITVSKEGYQSETVTVSPTLAGAGVLLGSVIDYGTGAVYNLTPNPVHVLLQPLPAATASAPQSPGTPEQK